MQGMDPLTAYHVVSDETMLDGNARLNLATFVTTWMDEEAQKLYADAVDKNMIDKDEYPQTAAIETYCQRMIADLWHAPDPAKAPGDLDDRVHPRRACSPGSRSSGAGRRSGVRPGRTRRGRTS